MKAYVDSSGQPIYLDQELGRGGEAAVFSLRNYSNLVAKLYLKAPSAERIAKLKVMFARVNPQLEALAAWPIRLIYENPATQPAGFLMPRVNDPKMIQLLYNPQQRARHFPQAKWNFQIRAARNLAAAFDEVHKVGCLVGDPNEKNALVSPQALVRIIDCDSFQVQANGKTYLCPVATPHYVSPELQGASWSTLTRTENHDCFGLAVLIYQLLFVGRHPYSGKYLGPGDPSSEQLIKEFRFAQGPAASNWLMSPPPHVPTFSDIPPEVGALFRRAFERGSERNNRPRPREWIAALEHLEQSLINCPQDSGHIYWSGAGVCTWCRLASNNGPEYYFGIGDSSQGFVVDDARLQEVLRRLAQIEQEDFSFEREKFLPRSDSQFNYQSPRITQLTQEFGSRTEQLRRAEQVNTRQDTSDREQANARFKQHDDSLIRQFGSRKQLLDAEMQTALEAVAGERQRRKFWEPLILGPAVLGLVLILFALYHWSFAAIGGCMSLSFGLWFGVFHFRAVRSQGELRVSAISIALRQNQAEYGSQRQKAINLLNAELAKRKESRQAAITALRESVQLATNQLLHEYQEETNRLRAAVGATENRVLSLENNWRSNADAHLRELKTHRVRINDLIAQCRLLSTQYASECKRVSANVEEAAKLRHLRLYSIIGADIPDIGFGRKQILANHGVDTAADISEERIRQISGFGEKLTDRLLNWRDDVLRQFRFSPSASVNSAELRRLAANYRGQERQIHAELERQIFSIQSSAIKCRTALESLIPELRTACDDFVQARAAEASFLATFAPRRAG